MNGIDSDNGGRCLTAVIMASGHGKRFGANKLLENFSGKPLAEKIFEVMPAEYFRKTVVVSIYDEILKLAEKYGFETVKNDDRTDDTAQTIKLGCENVEAGSDGIMFFAADQPLLRNSTIAELINTFTENKSKIVLPVCGGKRGNPVIFPSSMIGELSSLEKNGRGRDVIVRHADKVLEVAFDSPEDFFDIDYREDLVKAEKILNTR